jgi:hypothetical protein
LGDGWVWCMSCKLDAEVVWDLYVMNIAKLHLKPS